MVGSIQLLEDLKTMFEAEGTRAKALRWEQAWHVNKKNKKRRKSMGRMKEKGLVLALNVGETLGSLHF